MLKSRFSVDTALLIVGFIFIIYGLSIGIGFHNTHVIWFAAGGLIMVVFARADAARKAKLNP